MIVHPIAPLYSNNSKILILGSFPSVKSREQGFYYGHPQNRFWRVMAGVCGADVPTTIEEKARLILDNDIALWDVIHSCDITGSSDSSIKNVTPNDLSPILEAANIEKILVNGKRAEALYIKYIEPKTGIRATCLPSTSPANARQTVDTLTEIWKKEISGCR